MTEASLEHNLIAARDEHLVPGREIHMQDMRGYRFCKVGLITGTNRTTTPSRTSGTPPVRVTRHPSNSTHSTPTRLRAKTQPCAPGSTH
jgi:hypothetical protein